MTNREKVLKGLQHCTARAGLHECQPKVGDDCPYVDEADCKLTIMRDALELLKAQEPKTGHWIESAGADKCSVCGETYSDLYPDYQYTHYCPNCGAKMIG